jgi:hypothetical protein
MLNTLVNAIWYLIADIDIVDEEKKKWNGDCIVVCSIQIVVT